MKTLTLPALGIASGGMSACSAFDGGLAQTRVVTDDVGRQVEIPSARLLSSVYFTSPLAQIFCFTVAPDLLAGTCIQFREDQLELLPDGTERLVFLGSLSNGGSIDLDALDYMDTQVIFSISGVDLTDVNVNDALKLQEDSGIPVVLIDGSFDKISDSYRLLGKCLGREERANQLADYCKSVYERIRESVGEVPADERVSYYFAEGEQGLYTEPNASQHSRVFTVAGGRNVAADLEYVVGSMMMAETTLEQVVSWNPQFIITWDRESRYGASRIITESPQWASIDAVKLGRVFEMPSLPFAFCDRPPGVNRFLGVQWLAKLFYPDYCDYDMVDAVREFYSRCYWRDVTVEQAREILGTSYDYLKKVS